MIRKTLRPVLRATAALAMTLASVNITRAAGNETVLHTNLSYDAAAGVDLVAFHGDCTLRIGLSVGSSALGA